MDEQEKHHPFADVETDEPQADDAILLLLREGVSKRQNGDYDGAIDDFSRLGGRHKKKKELSLWEKKKRAEKAKQKKKERHGAVSFQKLWRGFRTRKWFSNNRAALEAEKLQREGRRKAAAYLSVALKRTVAQQSFFLAFSRYKKSAAKIIFKSLLRNHLRLAYRPLLLSLKEERRERCAVQIQKVARGRRAKRIARELFKQRETRRSMLLAITCQRLWRGKKGRDEAAARRKEKLDIEERKRAQAKREELLRKEAERVQEELQEIEESLHMVRGKYQDSEECDLRFTKETLMKARRLKHASQTVKDVTKIYSSVVESITRQMKRINGALSSSSDSNMEVKLVDAQQTIEKAKRMRYEGDELVLATDSTRKLLDTLQRNIEGAFAERLSLTRLRAAVEKCKRVGVDANWAPFESASETLVMKEKELENMIAEALNSEECSLEEQAKVVDSALSLDYSSPSLEELKKRMESRRASLLQSLQENMEYGVEGWRVTNIEQLKKAVDRCSRAKFRHDDRNKAERLLDIVEDQLREEVSAFPSGSGEVFNLMKARRCVEKCRSLCFVTKEVEELDEITTAEESKRLGLIKNLTSPSLRIDSLEEPLAECTLWGLDTHEDYLSVCRIREERIRELDFGLTNALQNKDMVLLFAALDKCTADDYKTGGFPNALKEYERVTEMIKRTAKTLEQALATKEKENTLRTLDQLEATLKEYNFDDEAVHRVVKEARLLRSKIEQLIENALSSSDLQRLSTALGIAVAVGYSGPKVDNLKDAVHGLTGDIEGRLNSCLREPLNIKRCKAALEQAEKQKYEGPLVEKVSSALCKKVESLDVDINSALEAPLQYRRAVNVLALTKKHVYDSKSLAELRRRTENLKETFAALLKEAQGPPTSLSALRQVVEKGKQHDYEGEEIAKAGEIIQKNSKTILRKLKAALPPKLHLQKLAEAIKVAEDASYSSAEIEEAKSLLEKEKTRLKQEVEALSPVANLRTAEGLLGKAEKIGAPFSWMWLAELRKDFDSLRNKTEGILLDSLRAPFSYVKCQEALKIARERCFSGPAVEEAEKKCSDVRSSVEKALNAAITSANGVVSVSNTDKALKAVSIAKKYDYQDETLDLLKDSVDQLVSSFLQEIEVILNSGSEKSYFSIPMAEEVLKRAKDVGFKHARLKEVHEICSSTRQRLKQELEKGLSGRFYAIGDLRKTLVQFRKWDLLTSGSPEDLLSTEIEKKAAQLDQQLKTALDPLDMAQLQNVLEACKAFDYCKRNTLFEKGETTFHERSQRLNEGIASLFAAVTQGTERVSISTWIQLRDECESIKFASLSPQYNKIRDFLNTREKSLVLSLQEALKSRSCRKLDAAVQQCEAVDFRPPLYDEVVKNIKDITEDFEGRLRELSSEFHFENLCKVLEECTVCEYSSETEATARKLVAGVESQFLERIQSASQPVLNAAELQKVLDAAEKIHFTNETLKNVERRLSALVQEVTMRVTRAMSQGLHLNELAIVIEECTAQNVAIPAVEKAKSILETERTAVHAAIDDALGEKQDVEKMGRAIQRAKDVNYSDDRVQELIATHGKITERLRAAIANVNDGAALSIEGAHRALDECAKYNFSCAEGDELRTKTQKLCRELDSEIQKALRPDAKSTLIEATAAFLQKHEYYHERLSSLITNISNDKDTLKKKVSEALESQHYQLLEFALKSAEEKRLEDPVFDNGKALLREFEEKIHNNIKQALKGNWDMGLLQETLEETSSRHYENREVSNAAAKFEKKKQSLEAPIQDLLAGKVNLEKLSAALHRADQALFDSDIVREGKSLLEREESEIRSLLFAAKDETFRIQKVFDVASQLESKGYKSPELKRLLAKAKEEAERLRKKFQRLQQSKFSFRQATALLKEADELDYRSDVVESVALKVKNDGDALRRRILECSGDSLSMENLKHVLNECEELEFNSDEFEGAAKLYACTQEELDRALHNATKDGYTLKLLKTVLERAERVAYCSEALVKARAQFVSLEQELRSRCQRALSQKPLDLEMMRATLALIDQYQWSDDWQVKLRDTYEQETSRMLLALQEARKSDALDLQRISDILIEADKLNFRAKAVEETKTFLFRTKENLTTALKAALGDPPHLADIRTICDECKKINFADPLVSEGESEYERVSRSIEEKLDLYTKRDSLMSCRGLASALTFADSVHCDSDRVRQARELLAKKTDELDSRLREVNRSNLKLDIVTAEEVILDCERFDFASRELTALVTKVASLKDSVRLRCATAINPNLNLSRLRNALELAASHRFEDETIRRSRAIYEREIRLLGAVTAIQRVVRGHLARKYAHSLANSLYWTATRWHRKNYRHAVPVEQHKVSSEREVKVDGMSSDCLSPFPPTSTDKPPRPKPSSLQLSNIQSSAPSALGPVKAWGSARGPRPPTTPPATTIARPRLSGDGEERKLATGEARRRQTDRPSPRGEKITHQEVAMLSEVFLRSPVRSSPNQERGRRALESSPPKSSSSVGARSNKISIENAAKSLPLPLIRRLNSN